MLLDSKLIDFNPSTVADPDSGFTQTQLFQMRKDGKEKPDNITWLQWYCPAVLKEHHYDMLKMHVLGFNSAQIARETKTARNSVSRVLTSPAGKAVISAYRNKMYDNIQTRFEEFAHEAINELQKMIEDPKVKPETRLNAIKEWLDRTYGKAEQKVKTEEVGYKDFIIQMEELRNAQTIDVKKVPSKADSFMENFIGERKDFVVGEKKDVQESAKEEPVQEERERTRESGVHPGVEEPQKGRGQEAYNDRELGRQALFGGRDGDGKKGSKARRSSKD